MDVEWFRARKKALNLSDDALGAAIGRDRSTANRLINGKVGFDPSFASGLANALQVTRSEILYRAGIVSEPPTDERPPPNATVVPMEGASLERMREDLPVFGSAMGAARVVDGEAIEQTTLNRSEVLHYAKRPVILNGNASAYGLHVAGSSMAPRYDDGELILVDPKAPLRTGDYVVLYLRTDNPEEDDGGTARAVLVKRLVRRTAAHYELEQFQPAKVFRIPRDEVIRAERVIPWSELLA